VDGFQGREKDIIIVSCVRAPVKDAPINCNDDVVVGRGVGFLKDWQVRDYI
jgi:superfamily I DNA and/or RNA helicase